MKILWLSWNFPPTVGGMEAMIENLFAGLRERGHEVRMVTAGATGAEARDGVSRAPRPGVPAFLVYSLVRGWALCRRMRPDVIVCGSVLSAPAAWLLGLCFRRRWVLPVYGSDLTAGGALYRMGLRFLLRRADRVLPISRFTESLVRSLTGDTRRCVIIHPGVDIKPFAREPVDGAEELLARCRGRRILLTVGRLVRRKGVLEFVRDVMPGLVARYPDVIYLVVGDDSSNSLIHRKEGMRKQVETVIREKGLEAHVLLLGRLSERDLVRLYFHSHVFVLPGLDLPGDIEGFGIVFSEAALAGVPAVATRAGGVPDAIEDGTTGLLVPPGDSKAMGEALESLFEDDARRHEMGLAAAQRARATLAWDVIVKRYEQVLEETIA